MKIEPGKLKGVFEINPTPHIDTRGFLVRTYDQKTFKHMGIDRNWIQESWSHTQRHFTLRGLHVQRSPYSETKLISIIHGAMKWVVVDVRKGSDTFGKWDSILLSAEQHNSLFVEAGFAHGCLSLSDDCELVIKSDREFVEGYGIGIAWNDPTIGIDWDIGDEAVIMSERDRLYSSFVNFRDTYKGI